MSDLDDLPIAQAARVQPHVHHRATLEQQGIRVGYWRCSQSFWPDRHCPDGPDPFATLIRRIAERPVVERTCTHVESRKYITVRHGKDVTVCRECNRIQMQRWRERRRAAA